MRLWPNIWEDSCCVLTLVPLLSLIKLVSSFGAEAGVVSFTSKANIHLTFRDIFSSFKLRERADHCPLQNHSFK
ncbi:hypothetical protein M758_1G064300 [Ceratodon purpureus]|uniref:Secreted protein n=1 Tax=Ceratodon purpureus TaxID=3225 RepID=A0A8T0J4Q7_CERPU|nr:hypothetical protein KC19_1G066300 [Ceratodon purpureus]KAG0628937.1 hypothetical protein M758_1G064300 [Ceratodon purpureus]